MNIKIIWSNLYPGGYREPVKTKETRIDDPFTTTPGDVEKEAVLDTPPGYYLSQIKFPGFTFKYNTRGKKTVEPNSLHKVINS